MPILIRASKMTCKHSIVIHSDSPISTPFFKGSININDRVFTGRGRSTTVVDFIPNDEGEYYYFAVHHCYPVDGAIEVAAIHLDRETTVQIFKLADHAVIKKRNLLSREMEILYFHNGAQVYSDVIKDRPPRTLLQKDVTLSTLPPEPSAQLKEFICNLKRY